MVKFHQLLLETPPLPYHHDIATSAGCTLPSAGLITSKHALTCSHFWRCSQHVFTSLASPRPVFASLDLSQLPYSCSSLAMSSGWSSPESLLSPESLCCHQSSFSFRVPCPWSSLSLEFLVLRVLQRSFVRLPPVFLELSLCSPMTSSFRHSFAALCLCS